MLAIEKDPLIKNMIIICEGLILLKHQKVRKAKKHVNQVWEQLSKHDHLYLSEIILLKNILFLFDLDTAEGMLIRSIKELEKYESLHETTELQVSILVNHIYILIRNEEIEKAIEILKVGKGLCIRRKRSDLLCDIFFYIALCSYKSGEKRVYHYYLEEVLKNLYLVSNIKKMEELIAELAIFVTSEEIYSVRRKYKKLEMEKSQFEL